MKTKDTRLYDLAYLIRNRRLELGYTSVEKFSNEKGINRSVYQRWESGEDLNLTSFLKLCDMHHISASTLFIKWEQANRLMPKDQPSN